MLNDEGINRVCIGWQMQWNVLISPHLTQTGYEYKNYRYCLFIVILYLNQFWAHSTVYESFQKKPYLILTIKLKWFYAFNWFSIYLCVRCSLCNGFKQTLWTTATNVFILEYLFFTQHFDLFALGVLMCADERIERIVVF